MKSTPQAQCDRRCSDHKDCSSCLKGTGAEGGWSECRWSTQLNEVCENYEAEKQSLGIAILFLIFNLSLIFSAFLLRINRFTAPAVYAA